MIYFIRYDAIHQRDEQSDGRTADDVSKDHTMHSLARYKNRNYFLPYLYIVNAYSLSFLRHNERLVKNRDFFHTEHLKQFSTKT